MKISCGMAKLKKRFTNKERAERLFFIPSDPPELSDNSDTLSVAAL